MLAEIEDAIIDLLADNGLNVRDVDLSSESIGNAKSQAAQRGKLPAVFCAVMAGTFKKIDEYTIRWQPRVLVAVAFKEFANDRKRRQGAVQILEAIVNLLSLKTLGLDIEGLVPSRWYNITDADLADKGIVVYQIEFSTVFDSEIVADTTDLADFLSAYVGYDINADGAADFTDNIELPQ